MKRWPTKPLGQVLEISRERIEPIEHPAKLFNYVGLESVEGHTGKLLEYQLTPGTEIKSTKNVFHPGEILYGKLRPYLNKVHLASMDGICSTDIYVLRPRQQQVHPSFAANFLRSPSVLAVVSNAMAGANLPRIGQDALLEISIPVPPLAEQEQIVKLLDEADELRKLRVQADHHTTVLISALFNEMFGDPRLNPKSWLFVSIGDILARPVQNGAYFPKEFYSDNDGVEMVHMGDAFNGIVERGELKRVICSAGDTKKYTLTSDDVLIARRSINYQGAAKPCLVPSSSEPLIFESSLIRVTPDPTKIACAFLFAYLSHPVAREAFVLPNVTRSTISGINQSGLLSIRIPLPPLALQKEFTLRMKEIGELEASQATSRARLDDLFQSMSHRAFNGEL